MPHGSIFFEFYFLRGTSTIHYSTSRCSRYEHMLFPPHKLPYPDELLSANQTDRHGSYVTWQEVDHRNGRKGKHTGWN